ncbi:MAG TPA: Tim44/TimA family putative adaptor protein [Stellaceae bacterium]|nr:Tim44/TimA family putative adaptor protein [Stellaceae bacterium]
MGDGYQFLDIVVFAVVAGLLVLRLRSVLGRRTGNERRRDPFAPPPAGATPPEKVVPLPLGRDRPPPAGASPQPAAGVAALKAADKSFDETHFLAGARGAFEIIVNAFAKGDAAALQPLLSDQVFASFTQAIAARRAQHETLETNLLGLKAVEIADAGQDGTIAHVTVKFVSEQMNVTRAADGSVVEGHPDQVEEKTDLWTFARPLRSRDPNWTLVATHSP